MAGAGGSPGGTASKQASNLEAVGATRYLDRPPSPTCLGPELSLPSVNPPFWILFLAASFKPFLVFSSLRHASHHGGDAVTRDAHRLCCASRPPLRCRPLWTNCKGDSKTSRRCSSRPKRWQKRSGVEQFRRCVQALASAVFYGC